MTHSCPTRRSSGLLGERRVLGGGQGPEPEGAVDMDPGAGPPRPGDDLGGRVEGAGIHVARLQADDGRAVDGRQARSEEHTSELQSLMRISYAVFCLKKKKKKTHT